MAEAISRFGGDLIEENLSEEGISDLTQLVNMLWEVRPKPAIFENERAHTIYEKQRKFLRGLAFNASMVDHPRYSDIIETWIDLQKNYAQFVDLNLEHLLKTKKKELARVTSAMPKKSHNSSPHLQELKQIVGRLESARKDLATLSESGVESIHYRIHSYQSLINYATMGEYKSPEFDPFRVEKGIKVWDMFDLTPPGLNPASEGYVDPSNLHPILQYLLDIKRYIDTLTTDDEFIRQDLNREVKNKENFSIRFAWGYIERLKDVYGIEMSREKPKKFKKLYRGPIMDDLRFLRLAKANLSRNHKAAVNEDYFKEALELLTDEQKAGFTSKQLYKIAHTQQVPLSEFEVRQNLTATMRDKYDVVLIGGDMLKGGQIYAIKPQEST